MSYVLELSAPYFDRKSRYCDVPLDPFPAGDKGRSVSCLSPGVDTYPIGDCSQSSFPGPYWVHIGCSELQRLVLHYFSG